MEINLSMVGSKTTRVVEIKQYERQRNDILKLIESKSFDALIMLVQSKFQKLSTQCLKSKKSKQAKKI